MKALKRNLTTALLIAVFLATTVTVRAQDTATDEPTPTVETTEQAPVVVVVEAPAPVEPAPADNTVPSFLLAAIVFGAIWLAREIFKQHGLNLEIVARTVPIEFAQYGFRQGMERALATPEPFDDQAIIEGAKQLGYEVFTDANGAFTIRASAQAVAQNVAAAKEAYERSKDR